MGGVYGDFLAFFSELEEEFKVYRYETRRDSGYNLTYSRTISAVRQSVAAKVDEKRYKQLAVLDIEKSYIIWTRECVRLEEEFVEIDGRMYRAMNQPDFNIEGGFWETRVNMIVGNDGTKRESPELDGGVF